MVVVVNDSYDASRGRFSTARRWCLVADGSFPSEARHGRRPALPSARPATSATPPACRARIPGVALLSVAGRLYFYRTIIHLTMESNNIANICIYILIISQVGPEACRPAAI